MKLKEVDRPARSVPGQKDDMTDLYTLLGFASAQDLHSRRYFTAISVSRRLHRVTGCRHPLPDISTCVLSYKKCYEGRMLMHSKILRLLIACQLQN